MKKQIKIKKFYIIHIFFFCTEVVKIKYQHYILPNRLKKFINSNNKLVFQCIYIYILNK